MTMNSSSSRVNAAVTACKQAFSVFLAIWFALSTSVSQLVHAQSSAADFETPIIEHEESSGGQLGGFETFNANVVDNEELASVKLFYRYSGEKEFTGVEMAPVATSSNYFTSIDSSGAKAAAGAEGIEAIEYYIRAEDAAGNLVLKGFAFEPLKRTFGRPAAAQQNLAQTNEPQLAPKKRLNWLYVGLGVLALGAIAGAAGSSGGNDPEPLADPAGSGTSTVTVSVGGIQ